MPSSPPDLTKARDTLRQSLDHLLQDQSPKIEFLAADSYPLLLLETHHELAGFALANGNTEHAYNTGYGFFKDLYAKRHTEWDNLNLSFVFCLQHRDERLDDFCTRIESDTFFCRKFVITLDEALEKGLTRLPFAPLESSDSVFTRPPSAQTLLQHLGVPAVLASYLVVPGQRDEGGIIDDCSAGKFGDPKPLKFSGERSRRAPQPVGQTVRLKQLRIQNFRAYRSPQDFDLDADFVFLYGPNGFGKTSFFDALDFLATGDIGRLEIRDRSRFPKVARHLNSHDETSLVSAQIGSDRGEEEIVRHVDSPTKATLNNSELDRRHTLLALVGAAAAGTADRVENLIRLFRATHLFSQEMQTLMEEFRQHCRLSADVVSRMLAFEDYVNGVNKSSKVIDRVRRRIREADQEISATTDALTTHRAELEKLQSAARSAEDPGMLVPLITDICVKVRDIGIEAKNENVQAPAVREWRALVESKAAAVKAEADRLRNLQTALPQITTLRATIASDKEALAQKERDLNVTEQSLLESRNTLSRGATELEALQSKQQALVQKRDSLERHRRVKPEYDRLQQQQAAFRASAAALSVRMRELQSQLQTTTSEVSNLRQQLVSAQKERGELSEILSVVAWLVAKYSLWNEHKERIKQMEQSLTEDERQALALGETIQRTTAEFSETALLVQQLGVSAEQQRNKQSELQNLIAQVEIHVTGPECPVCGINHGSIEILLQHLRAQQASLGVVPTQVIATFEKASEKAQALAASLEELRTKQQNTAASIHRTKAEIERIREEIRTFEAQAAKVRIALSGDVLRELENSRGALAKADADLGLKIDRITQGEIAATKRSTDTQLEIEDQAKKLNGVNLELQKVVLSLVNLLNEQPIDVSLLETSADALTAASADNEAQVAAVNASVVQKASEVNAFKGATDTASQRVNILKHESVNLQNVLAKGGSSLATYEREIQLLGLPAVPAEDELTRVVKEKEDFAILLSDLITQISSVEIALDAAATSAAIKARVEEAKIMESKIRSSTVERDSCKRWSEFFQGVLDALEKEQNRAVADYTDAYGPLTTTIQRRLRSVYGFEDVILKAIDGEIAVRVMKNEEQLQPTDYFSQSQQQILMLSLFLTACVTQTWSSFGPILLDDPVTHFDDLNAYSFLDLIGGLLTSEAGHRQFIVSTCEERLFQLARQKFSNMQQRVRIYQFVSTGIDGPVIERVE